jgi:hypothetical protein
VIERGILHNPHYYEYLTSNQFELCSQEVEPITTYRIHLDTILLKLNESTCNDETKDAIKEHVKRMIFLRENVYPDIPVDNENTNQDLRISFLTDKITEEEWKSALYKRYKHNRGYSSYRYILDTYFTITREWLSDIVCFAPIFLEKYTSLCATLNDSIVLLKKQYKFAFTLL